MSKSVAKPAVLVAVALLAAGPLVAQEDAAPLSLEMESVLSEQSLDKIADGSASAGQSRLTPESAPNAISLPVGLLGALALVLAGFAAGALLTRRSSQTGDSVAPVALWLDAEKLQSERDDLESELSKQQRHNQELAEDREQLLLLHADQMHKLRGEKEEFERELSAWRLRGDGSDGDAQQLIDELRVELEQLRGADKDAPDRRDRPADEGGPTAQQAEFDAQRAHIEQLEELLRGTHDENESLEQRLVGSEAQLETLTATLLTRDEELQAVRTELQGLREKAELLDERESHVATLDNELTNLRDEMNQLLGKTGQYQILIPALESKLFHRKEQIGALESDLQATADEIAERERDSKQWQGQVQGLQNSLEAAAVRIDSLELDLASALEKNELLRRDPDTDELHNENLSLKQKLRDVEEQRRAAAVKLDELRLHRERVDDWNTTVTSLQAEIRRKSSLIDSQADHLNSREQQISLLQAEMEDLRKQLVTRSEETQSLRNLLEEAGNVVVSLRDEMGDGEHAATRQRLARNPSQDPAGIHEDSVEPIEADIEALRFTARSRRDLGDSLETILKEERAALEQASRRVNVRDEEVTSLKNELAANRVAMVTLQSRLNDFSNDGETGPIRTTMEPARIERELHQSMRVLEALRADLHKWRGRVKPLHEALLSRNERIHALEAEVAALRQAQGLDPAPGDDDLVDDVTELLHRTQHGEQPERERARILDDMKLQWDRIVALETDLADTGARLARVLELDDARCRQIESLELARGAQVARLAELQTELSANGIDPGESPPDTDAKVVDLGTRRPS